MLPTNLDRLTEYTRFIAIDDAPSEKYFVYESDLTLLYEKEFHGIESLQDVANKFDAAWSAVVASPVLCTDLYDVYVYTKQGWKLAEVNMTHPSFVSHYRGALRVFLNEPHIETDDPALKHRLLGLHKNWKQLQLEAEVIRECCEKTRQIYEVKRV